MGSHTEEEELVEDLFSGEVNNYEPYQIDAKQAAALNAAGVVCEEGWWLVSNIDDFSQSRWLVDNIEYLDKSESEAQEICDEYWEAMDEEGYDEFSDEDEGEDEGY